MIQLEFSDPYKWENDAGVIQMLVFGCFEAKRNFDNRMADPSHKKTTEGYPDENNQGALYKIRAVKNSSGTYDSVIRCGITAYSIHERKLNTANPYDALIYGIDKIRHCFGVSCEDQIQKMRNLHE